MSFLKISSDQIPKGCPPIRDRDCISWHFALFEDLMTEKSKMLATSFLTKVESGIVGSGLATVWSQWLLHETIHVQCFLREKSIWKWSGNDKDIVYFIEVVEHNNILSSTRKKSDIAAAKVNEFAKKAKNEVRNLAGYFDLNKELNLAQQEIHEFSCACFRDYWKYQDFALLDTTFSSGKFKLIIIRRGYIQGWWALALRKLGQLLRDKMQSRPLPGGSNARGKKHARMGRRRQIVLNLKDRLV